MRVYRIATLLPLMAAIFLFPAAGRGLDETADTEPFRIVQAGSAAFIVQNALYLFPEAPDLVVAVADGDQGNGWFLGDLDPEIDRKTVLARTATTEAIIAERPDIVVMKNFMAGRMGAPLEQVGVGTFYLDLETPEAWMADLDSLGELFDNLERAAELKDLSSRWIKKATDPLSDLADSDRPSTLFLYWSVKDGVTAVNVPPMGWMQTRLVEMAGGDPVWKDAELSDRWTRVGIEQIAAWDPDHIVVAAYHIPTSQAIDAILSDPVWKGLRAVEEGNIHGVPVDYHSWDQPDARWLLGLSWMAGQLHPERYAEPDLEAETRRFYRDFFFMDDEDYDRMIAPRLDPAH